MDTSLFLQGMIAGLALAVPVGPISIICIHRAVAGGRLHGILSGFGIATADSFYAAVAFLGITAVSGLVISHQPLFRFLAGVALVIIGIQVFRSVPHTVRDPVNTPESYIRGYLSLLAITAANPLTIIFFMTILPGFGIVPKGTALPAAIPFVLGVFLGSAVWWVVLCGVVGSVRSWLDTENLRRINQASGLLIAGTGAGMLLLLITAPGLLP